MEEIISIIVWPIALSIVLICFQLIFKRPITDLIKGGKWKFKRGETEFVSGGEISHQGTTQISTETLVADAPKKPEIEQEDLPSNDKDSLTSELYAAYYANDSKKLDEAYSKLQLIDQDGSAKFKDQALYLYMKALRGNINAVSELKELSGKEEIASIALRYLGLLHERTGSHQKAIEYLTKSVEKSRSEEEKTGTLVHLASSHAKVEGVSKAEEILLSRVQQISDENHISEIYTDLADIYKEYKRNDLEQLALEKAIEFSPNNTALLFRIAYLYGETDEKELCSLYYSKLTELDPKQYSAQNNLGVQMQALGMPILSVSRYLRSHSGGETLATANLAYKYLDAGFTKDASNLLKTVMETTENLHENVGSAFSETKSREKYEETKFASVLSRAEEKKAFMTDYGKMYFLKSTPQMSIEGTWSLEDGTSATLSYDKSVQSIEIIWGPEKGKKKISGQIENLTIPQATKFVYQKNTWKISDEYEFSKEGNGLGFLSEALKTLQFMIKRKNSEVEYYSFKKA